MPRRLCALLLVLACVLAPVLPAHEVAPEKAMDCCAKGKCGCDKTACPVPAAPAPIAQSNATVIEQRATPAKPATRVTLAAFIRYLSLSENENATQVRPISANRVAPAASVALFEAHCSRLI